MRILYLITGLRLGGAEKQLLLLARNMQQAGFEVLIVAMEAGGVMVEDFRRENIKVAELNITNATTLAQGYRNLKKLVKRFSPHVIHSHMIHANLFARVFRLFNKGFKLISTAHNIREGGKLLMTGYKFTATVPDWSTNVSREAFEYFVKNRYFNPAKSSYLPNAIDTTLFSPGLSDNRIKLRAELSLSINDYVFFTAGRLHEQKNHQMLLKSFEIIQRNIQHAVLVIAGEGQLHTKLRAMAMNLGIQSKVIFLGRRDDMPALLNMCDCFVLSSKYEGFGLVVGEAIAMQKPVVATNCGGVKEVMGGYGILVQTDDVQDMADAMIKTYQSPPSTNYLVKARRHIEDHYAVPVVIKQWINLYSN